MADSDKFDKECNVEMNNKLTSEQDFMATDGVFITSTVYNLDI